MKKSNNTGKVAVIIAFILCISSFTAAAIIGTTELYKVSGFGNPFQLLSSKSYENSGALQRDFSEMFDKLCWMGYNQEAHNFKQVSEEMAAGGFYFYLTDGVNAFSNMELGVDRPSVEELRRLGERQGGYRLFYGGVLEGAPVVTGYNNISGDGWLLHSITNAQENSNFLGEGSGKIEPIYLAFSPDYVAAASERFGNASEELIAAAYVTAACLLLGLLSLAVLCGLCGKRDNMGKVVLTGIDRWFTELLLLLFSAAAGCVLLVEMLFVDGMSAIGYSNSDLAAFNQEAHVNSWIVALAATGMLAALAVALYAFLSLVKKGKGGHFFRDFFVVKICVWIWSGVKDIYYGSSVMKKVILMVSLMCLCSATVVFFPVVIVVSLILAAKWVRQYEAIKKGVQEVKNGKSSYQIPIDGELKGELQQLAADINSISSGFDLAVKQELKNQRMKTELISNVSHDIKTPLTSIITYVDLLKKEGLDCEEAPKYLDILDQKSIRLKKLTEDLFEAAKASSGDIPVNLEKLELMSLISQTLAEMDDRLASKGLDVIVKATSEKFYVAADGQLLWRVLENLLGNAIKYALENSRVYVDIREVELHTDGRSAVILEMKNVSKNPLNIPSDELMERFKRGDEARSTEGSGLGLSIARDLVSMQHGKFEIVIDGDLFKAVITLEVCQ